MHHAKHAEHHQHRPAHESEMPAGDRDTYQQWHDLLVAEKIINEDGLVDLEKLEERYPDALSKSQIVWIEAMHRGEIEEETTEETEPEPEELETIEDAQKYKVGDSFDILVDEDGEPETVTVVGLGSDGIRLSSSVNKDTEYLVDPDELGEMIVE